VGDCRAKSNTSSTLVCTIRPHKASNQDLRGFSTINTSENFKAYPVKVNVLTSVLAKLDSRKPSEVRMKRLSPTQISLELTLKDAYGNIVTNVKRPCSFFKYDTKLIHRLDLQDKTNNFAIKGYSIS
jgi:hypothetical protein